MIKTLLPFLLNFLFHHLLKFSAEPNTLKIFVAISSNLFLVFTSIAKKEELLKINKKLIFQCLYLFPDSAT